jgi:hypothetical protein
LRITTNANDTPRNWSCQIWRSVRRPSCRSEGLVSTRCHQLRGDDLSIWRTGQHTLPSTSRHRPEGRRRYGSRVEADLFARTLLPPSQRRAKKDKT